jgi:hypothetical protein
MKARLIDEAVRALIVFLGAVFFLLPLDLPPPLFFSAPVLCAGLDYVQAVTLGRSKQHEPPRSARAWVLQGFIGFALGFAVILVMFVRERISIDQLVAWSAGLAGLVAVMTLATFRMVSGRQPLTESSRDIRIVGLGLILALIIGGVIGFTLSVLND